MKAITHSRYGSPDVLELSDVDEPVPDDDEVQIRVHAAGVNALDWHMLRGEPTVMRLGTGIRRPKHRFRGVDVAGTVESVGADVTEFEPGDEVFGWCSSAFAEYTCAGADQFLEKPETLSFEAAAAVPTAGITALQGLRDQGELQAGQDVLIIGASGGVGSFAVQIATADGAHVTGVCSTEKADLVESLGAEEVLDYTTRDVLAGDREYDLILDIAGNRPLSRLRGSLRPEGTLVIAGGEEGDRLTGGLHRNLAASVISAFVSHRLRWWVATNDRDDLRDLAALIEAGDVTPAVDRTFELAETPDAIRYVEDGRARGKVVVTP